ncbi:hypothetical protein K458DRAFT_389162 [Lentithecium fluviatile CBS 122367]|uniref:Uncharacterized protein n=1 Tax=Lentithecium fluviatile CBS 122367 TaxID=1168545 RepID=A0A6G1J167_9PLEO|nr:hypothetical protein K458DRAFT_389162 [Lentithecium fluviatile CBS 122367]
MFGLPRHRQCALGETPRGSDSSDMFLESWRQSDGEVKCDGSRGSAAATERGLPFACQPSHASHPPRAEAPPASSVRPSSRPQHQLSQGAGSFMLDTRTRQSLVGFELLASGIGSQLTMSSFVPSVHERSRIIPRPPPVSASVAGRLNSAMASRTRLGAAL